MLACLLRYAWWRVISCTWTEAWTSVSLCLTRASALGRDTESWHFTPQESTVCILGLRTASRRKHPYRRDSKVARLPILLLRTAKSRGEIIVVVDLEHVWKSESVCLSCEEVWEETCFPVLHLPYTGQCVDIHPENVTMRCTPEQRADGEKAWAVDMHSTMPWSHLRSHLALWAPNSPLVHGQHTHHLWTRTPSCACLNVEHAHVGLDNYFETNFTLIKVSFY